MQHDRYSTGYYIESDGTAGFVYRRIASALEAIAQKMQKNAITRDEVRRCKDGRVVRTAWRDGQYIMTERP